MTYGLGWSKLWGADHAITGIDETLDLRPRFGEIEYTLKTINDNLSIFRAIINQRESSLLELSIIILILVEIIDLFITTLFNLKMIALKKGVYQA
jgi:uncharacterized Rmd1/YagE family protein